MVPLLQHVYVGWVLKLVALLLEIRRLRYEIITVVYILIFRRGIRFVSGNKMNFARNIIPGIISTQKSNPATKNKNVHHHYDFRP